MIDFVKFEPDHLGGLHLQDAQVVLQPLLTNPEYGEMLAVPGLAWSGEINGEIVGSAGVLPQGAGRAVVWALFGHAIPLRAWPAITNFVKKNLELAHEQGIHRLEAVVDPAFHGGCRWAEKLGFTCETPHGMLGYSPDKKTYLLFARVDL